MTDFNHSTYISPYTWRYGSEAMRRVWSLETQRKLWRRIWLALAEAQQQAGLVRADQVADLRAHVDDIDIARALEIEAEIHHDLMAEVRTYAEQCPVGGGIIHLGATSMDVEDNADALRLRDALDLIVASVRDLLRILADRIEAEADRVCMAFTHLQPAEPTTVGYRLANYAQDLLADYTDLVRIRAGIRGKGFKGAVGTGASYAELLRGTALTPADLEARIMQALSLDAFTIAHQTYPRRQDWAVVNALASVAMTGYRLAFDVRLLQSPPFGEWAEPFGAKQVGSSAMPFKRNPINAENVDSLARLVAALPRVAWDNAAHHLLERTLDDSGNRRSLLPEAFLVTDEILRRLNRIVSNLRIDASAVAHNLQRYGTFAATERVLMEAARHGGDRQELHEVIREHSLAAWDALRAGQPNPLPDLLASDDRITRHVDPAAVRDLLDASGHIGDAPDRARRLATSIHSALA
ncbi:MAG: adenylosuccinate lyase [Anaerolineae bacterium]|nr:MAG: adenylosuccinate lyase [Chloroflexi bacterium OLB13]MBW7880761.1 adenylosuccinate lyase [Anaerolineae bacterium]MEB2367277.1 adenylosuccinate lyase [Chloroflexota bacterium]